MLLTNLSKTLLASYSANIAEVELPFCDRHHMGYNTHTRREGALGYLLVRSYVWDI